MHNLQFVHSPAIFYTHLMDILESQERRSRNRRPVHDSSSHQSDTPRKHPVNRKRRVLFLLYCQSGGTTGAAGAATMRPLGCADRPAGPRPHRGLGRFADPGSAGAATMRPLGCADRPAGPRPHRGLGRFADPGSADAATMRPLGCADRPAGPRPHRGLGRFADPGPHTPI